MNSHFALLHIIGHTCAGKNLLSPHWLRGPLSAKIRNSHGMATVEFAICLPVVILMASVIFYFVSLNGYENALLNVTEQTVRVISEQANWPGISSSGAAGENTTISDDDALQIASKFSSEDLNSRLSMHLDYLDGGFVKLRTELDLSGTPIAWIKPQLHSELTSKVER